MVSQVVLAVCFVLGLCSYQVTAQWSNNGQQGQGQGQGGALVQAGSGQQGMGMGQGAGMGFGQSQAGGFGQMSGQGMGMSPVGGQGMGMSPMAGQGMGMPPMAGQGMGMPPMGVPGMGRPPMGMSPPLPAMAFGTSLSPTMNLGRSQASGWRDMFQTEDDAQFLTCTAANSNNDDMRVTFINQQNSRSPWGMFNRLPGNSRQLRLEARITSGQGSQTQGQYQLIVTRYSRSEEVCLSRALGEILTDQTPAWWGSQNRTPRGIVGAPMRIMSGQTATVSETVDTLRFEELAGRGMALCPSHHISGTTCRDPMPLCCKIGYDTQRATTPFTPINQMFSMGGAGSTGLGGFNQGLGNQQLGGQGFDSGLGGQQFGGLSQGSQNSFNAGASSNQGPLPFRK